MASRPTLVGWVLAAVLLALACAACSGKRTALAELAKADGPVEREAAGAPWRLAPIGTQFFVGDAARTAGGAAELAVPGGARLAMQPHTVLRFGGKAAGRGLVVEAGAIDISGEGRYELDVGDVTVSPGATVRVAARGAGRRAIELKVGAAQISTEDGGRVELQVGRAVELGVGAVVVTAVVDAALPGAAGAQAGAGDAGIAVDAPEGDGAALEAELTGRVEVTLPGERTWKALPPGARRLEKGTVLRVPAGGSAKLSSRGVSLELGGGARASVGDDLTLAIEAGAGRASATGGVVRLPGGALALGASAAAPATSAAPMTAPATSAAPPTAPATSAAPPTASEARFDVGAREAAVAIARGAGKLSGAPGTDLAMARGESAVLGRAGTIRVVDAIPTRFDLRVPAGETLTVHDPRPPSAVQLQFGDRCPEGGIIELDRDGRFRTPRVSAGKDAANLRVDPGAWTYRLRCTTGGGEGAAVATGRIAVLHDAGTRALPKARPPNDIDADGRTWRISYQSVIPDLRVHARGVLPPFRLILSRGGGKNEAIEATAPVVTVPGASLREGTFTYWIEASGALKGKISTLVINFDQTAAQVYIESPEDGAAWTGDLDVRGAVLPGWTASVDTVAIPLDRQRRFAARVGAPAGGTLVIKLAHPERGIHYYLRRSK
ncbi:MAG TPA: hypothetical protein VNO30_06355 [Kofleriaceae bacterium]|nr:hypothetical protein [Kofleriaceae bacterium]